MNTPANTYPHLGGAHPLDANTYMEDVFGYLLVRYQVKSVLDIGCGYGPAMKWFSRFQCDVRGVEGWPEALAKSDMKHAMTAHDYERGPAPLGDARYDLCWCAEFVEHVEERFADNFLADMARCRWIVMTHGEPGQDGWHHVNCRDDAYWIEKLGAHDLLFNEEETARLRLTDRWKAGWGRRTLMFFENRRFPAFSSPRFVPLEPIYSIKP